MKKHSPTFFAGIVPALILIFNSQASRAGSATWKPDPISRDWNTARNWTPMTVPNGRSDIATFRFSTLTDLFVSGQTPIDGVVFDPGASAFTIRVVPDTFFIFAGTGITNNSGTRQTFTTRSVILGLGAVQFRNNATAGSGTLFINSAAGGVPGEILFFDDSSAGNASFVNKGSDVHGSQGGRTEFSENSSAAHGSFINEGNVAEGAAGGATIFFFNANAGSGVFTNNANVATSSFGAGGCYFFETASASDGTFINNGSKAAFATGGFTLFDGHSTAGNATLIANGGSGGGRGGLIRFTTFSDGGTARVKLYGNGRLVISGHDRSPVTIGSLEGDGVVSLAQNKLVIGSNGQSTNFSGLIQGNGSVTKVGAGTLFLLNANTYTAGTIVEGGKLVVNNTIGSATGSGPLVVNHGRLGGKGAIAGSVTVGIGSGSGAVIAPGMDSDSLFPLTIQSALTFNSDASYHFGLNSRNGRADKVIANGVTINNAQFSFRDFGDCTLPIGTGFTAIKNTSASPIAGTFGNLPDNSTFSSNGNTYKVDYQGGDGNDLTLTVQ
jgi:autotransporter-associated beta strand protein